jgi:WD40 repeat protein
VLLAAGTACYDDPSLSRLEKVPVSLRTVVAALGQLGVRPVADDPPYQVDPKLDALKQAIGDAARAHPLVVVYYTGHAAHPDRDHYYLIVRESQRSTFLTSALSAADLPLLLMRKDEGGTPEPEQPEVLLIIDCCFAGGGAEEIGNVVKRVGNRRVWVLASAGNLEYAEDGRFANALAEALRQPLGGASMPYLGLESISYAINVILGTEGQITRHFPPREGGIGLAPFFRNPTYEPGVAGRTVSEQHWISRLHGVPEATTGFYLTGRSGRVRAVADLVDWLTATGRSGLAVLTGSPGSGKSTLLAIPVQLSQRRTREQLLGPGGVAGNLLVSRAAGLVSADASLIAVHGHGLNADQVAQEIASQLGRRADSATGLLQDLGTAPDTKEWAVVVDALDEAIEPLSLLDSLLVPLAHRPGLRVAVGTRRHLLGRIGPTDLSIDLDTEPYLDPEALVDYIRELLLATHEPDASTPYRSVEPEVADAVARKLADRATTTVAGEQQAESFLIGQLLARSTRSRPWPADTATADWRDRLPSTLGEAFEEDLARLTDNVPVAHALLRALAWANGPGLPWENIWVPVARALAGGDTERTVTDSDVRQLLDRAGAYIVEDVGPGQRSVFRPVHHLLTIHFRELAAATATARDPQAVQQAVTDALVNTVPLARGGHRAWTSAHPYLRTYLALHASEAGAATLADLTREVDLLAVADPVTLTPLLSPTVAELRDAARVYRRVRPLLGDRPEINAAYLGESTLALNSDLANAPTGLSPVYRTSLAAVSPDDSVLTLTAPEAEVRAVALGAAPDGRLLLAAGTAKGQAQVWDARTGSAVGEPLITYSAAVSRSRPATTALAFCLTADGRLRMATGNAAGTVRLWDPDTGELLTEPAAHGHRVHGLAFLQLPGDRMLIAAAVGDAVQVWNGAHGDHVAELTGASNLTKVAVGAAQNGGSWLIAGSPDEEGDDSTVLLWNWGTASGPSTADLVARHQFSGHVEAVGVTAEMLPVCVLLDEAEELLLWNAVNATRLGRPIYLTEAGWRPPVGFGETPDGNWLVAYQTPDSAVHVRNMRSGTTVNNGLRGHRGETKALAFGAAPDGHLLLASGGADGTVRLWDPASRPMDGRGRESHYSRGPVRQVAMGCSADGQIRLVSRDDGGLHLWGQEHGEWAGVPLIPGPALDRIELGPVLDRIELGTPFELGTTSSGGLLLAGWSREGGVQLWDAITGTPVEPTSLPHAVRVWLRTASNGRLLLGSEKAGFASRYQDPLTGTVVWDGASWASDGGTTVTSFDGGTMVTSFERDTRTEDRVLLTNAKYRDIHVLDAVSGASVDRTTMWHSISSTTLFAGPDGHLLLAAGTPFGGIAERPWPSPVLLWDLTEGPDKPPHSFDGHQDWVSSVAFGTLPGGSPFLVSGGEDQTVRLWDPVALRPLATLHRRSRVRAVAALGSLLAVGDDEGLVVIEVDDSLLSP